ncbi:MAG: hypothetical protein GKR97_01475 [Rhizobiaceae bacterium]|nr:hypothetical protein [Rhizobiaceae bacterium]
MAQTYAQMEHHEISNADDVTAEEALQILNDQPNSLLVDVRDESEVDATGMGVGAFHAPGRSVAWLADLESEYRSHRLQDRSIRILTTCGGSPCFRGASAANVLTAMGFANVSFVEGGMKALISAGIATGPRSV